MYFGKPASLSEWLLLPAIGMLASLYHHEYIFGIPTFFSGASAKLRKTTISCVMSVGLSIRTHGTVRLPLDRFVWNLTLEFFFRKSVENIQVWLKYDKNNGYFKRRPMYIYEKSRRIILRVREVSKYVYKPTRCTKFLWLDFIFH